MRAWPFRRGRRGTLIFLCVWHVKRAWLKNLQKKVSSYPVREQMLKELTEVLEARETDKARAGMDAFLKKWVRASVSCNRSEPLPNHESSPTCDHFASVSFSIARFAA